MSEPVAQAGLSIHSALPAATRLSAAPVSASLRVEVALRTVAVLTVARSTSLVKARGGAHRWARAATRPMVLPHLVAAKGAAGTLRTKAPPGSNPAVAVAV